MASNNGILLLLMSLWLAGCCCWSRLGLAAAGCACSCICGQLAGHLGAGWSRLASLMCPQDGLQFSAVMRAPESYISHHPASVTKEGKQQCASTFHVSYLSHLLLYHWPQSKSHGQAQSQCERGLTAQGRGYQEAINKLEVVTTTIGHTSLTQGDFILQPLSNISEV